MADHIQISNAIPRVQFVGDGITASFLFPFVVFTQQDLEVYLDDVLQRSEFSVSGAGSSAGGTVTFTAPPANGVSVTLLRRLVIRRVTDFQESGDFRASTLNDELDYQTAALQDLAADIAAAIRVSPTDREASLVLPKVADRAGKLIGFDQEGGVQAVALMQGGAGDHGQLAGLDNDDHPQYLTEVRATAWLGTRTADSLAEGITNKYMRLAGSGTSTTAARTDHHHTGTYEPTFPKNSAFNRNFGTGSNDVAAGNHTHALDLTPFALSDLGNVSEAGRAEGYVLTWSTAAAQWEPRPQTGGGGSSGRFGLRNLLTNAIFRINQRRNFATSLAAGVYGYDRWRGGNTGCTYSVSGTTADITAGSLVQTIDGANIVEAGPYTLTWEGTATATVNGNPVANGGQVTLIAFANVVVAFSGGTLAKPQLEQNPLPTPFEQRPHELELQLCLPYYQKSYALDVAPGTAVATGNKCITLPANFTLLQQSTWGLPCRMRTTPNITIYNFSTGAMDHVAQPTLGSSIPVVPEGGDASFIVIAVGPTYWTLGEYAAFHWTAEAEF